MQTTSKLSELSAAAEREFEARFGRPARFVAAAPGRVNLIGEHTDYNDGFVLPMAIDRHVVLAADRAPAGQDRVRLYSVALEQWAEIARDSATSARPVGWASYVHGVIEGCRQARLDAGPFDAVIASNLPLGGGLSSSAALEVAAATLVEALAGLTLNPLQKALLCQKAEHDFAGVPCGVMDQCSSILGRADALLLLDCRSLASQPIPMTDPDVAVLVIDTNVRHALGDGEYARRREECGAAAKRLGVKSLREVSLLCLERSRAALGDVLFRRARHVATENARTLAVAEAIPRGDWPAVGRRLYASHASLRDDYQVSCPELDLLVQRASTAEGAIGARMTGGGFGGCVICLVHRPHLETVSEQLAVGYLQHAGRSASLFVIRPADGAGVLKQP